MSPLILGVDGGNTKTIALVADTDGAIVGKGRAGCADVHAAFGSAAAIDEIVAAVSEALKSAGAQPPEIAASAFSLAGADWQEDFEFLRRSLAARLALSEPRVVNDAVGLLRCGSAAMTGVAVAIGTGGALASRNRAGDVYHYGFWPDPMGGAALASAAMRAVYRADLGLGEPTSLTGRVCAVFDVSTPRELLFALNQRDAKVDVSSRGLPALVLDEAEAGDAVARSIVQEIVDCLGRAARITADAVGLDAGDPLVLGGGVLTHPSTLLSEGIAEVGGFDAVVRTDLQPVVGALLMALDTLGIEVQLETIAASMPELAFFATA